MSSLKKIPTWQKWWLLCAMSSATSRSLALLKDFSTKLLVRALANFVCFVYKTTTCLNPSTNTHLPGLANRTAEKVKPSALDLLLLFRETVRLKQMMPGAKKASLRDVLFGSIAEYNKSIGNHRVSWQNLVHRFTPHTEK